MKALICFAMFCSSLCSQPLKSLSITVDDSFRPDLKPNFQAVANDVASIVTDLFESRRPPLDLPIVCYLKAIPPIGSKDNSVFPETTLDNWNHPKQIRIGVTPNTPVYAQLAYQLGHEMGHVMLDPRRTNGVIETIATAVSYAVLDRIADKWAMVAPFPWLRSYVNNFRKYRDEDAEDRLTRLSGMRHAVDQHDWTAVRSYLYDHRSEQDQNLQAEIDSQHGRDIQTLGAISLLATQVSWRKFIGLSVTCSSIPLLKQRSTQPPSAFSKQCLPRLSGALCPIGRGCPGLGLIP